MGAAGRGRGPAPDAGARHRVRAVLPVQPRLLTGTVRCAEHLDAGGFRSGNPRFTGENFQRTQRIAGEVEAVAAEPAATAARIAPARLLAQGEDMALIPGTTGAPA